MNDLNSMDLDALRVELAYRRALLKPHTDGSGFRARLPRRLRRRPVRDAFTTS